MINKDKLIHECLNLNVAIFEKDKIENSIKDLNEWFDTDKVNKRNVKKWFGSYIDDLYSYLLDYSITDLKERIKGEKKYLKTL